MQKKIKSEIQNYGTGVYRGGYDDSNKKRNSLA